MLAPLPALGATLITGATGLIGSNLARLLPGSAQLARADLPDARAWRDLPQFDTIIHAAGYAAPARFLDHSVETAFLNTTALQILLSKLRPTGRLLYLSSSELYTGSTRIACTESDIGTTTPQHARAIYIESKRCGEAICSAARHHGQNAITARVSSAYGPGCRRADKRVMSEFIDAALLHHRIELRDGGSARRAWLYISDLCSMLLTILERGTQSLYNVGGIDEMSILTLAKKIADQTGAGLRVPRGMGTALEGSPSHIRLDMSRFIREFGEPLLTPFDEGLRETISWHRALHGALVHA